MICLIDTRSRLSVATIIFYTCIWIPIRQIREMVLDMVCSILSAFHEPIKGNDLNKSLSPVVVDLPTAKFEESTKYHREDGSEHGCSAEASCSICLVEYESEDMVTQLPRCGHMFHIDCIKRWLDRNQFTCPLCRDLLLHFHASSPCNGKRRRDQFHS